METRFASPPKPAAVHTAAMPHAMPRPEVPVSAGALAPRAPELSGKERTAQGLQTISGVTQGFWMMDLVAMPFALVGMGLAKLGLKRTGAVFKFVQSPFQAANRTSLADIGHWRGNTLKSASRYTTITGGDATKWTAGLDHAAKAARVADTKRVGKIAAFFKPFISRIGAWIDGKSASRGGQFAEKHLKGFIKWRHGVNQTKTAEFIEKSAAAAQSLGMEAFMKKEDPLLRSLANELNMRAARGAHLKGPSLIQHFESLGHYAEELVGKHKMMGGQAKALYELKESFDVVAKSAAAVESHAGALEGGLKSLVKGLGHMGGRLSILQGILAVGTAAAIPAIALTASHETDIEKKALKDLVKDLDGDTKNKLVVEARRVEGGVQTGRAISTAVTSAAEMANVPIAGHMAGASMSAIGLQVMGPTITEMLVPKNAVLNGYAVLKRAEQSGQKLPPEAMVEHIRQLVSVIEVKNQEGKMVPIGFHNQVNIAVSEEMANRGMSAREIVRLISDMPKFTEFTAEVKAKMHAPANENHAEAAKEHAVAVERNHAHAGKEHAVAVEQPHELKGMDENHAHGHSHEHAVEVPHAKDYVARHQTPAVDHVLPHANDKPLTKVAAIEAEHEGKLATAVHQGRAGGQA